jgi:invasion protein IalB
MLSKQIGAAMTRSAPAVEKGMEDVAKFPMRATPMAVALVFTALTGLAFAHPVYAQEQAPAKNSFGPRLKPGQGDGAAGPAPAAPTVLSTHGDWKVQCEPSPEGAAAAPQQCGMVQTAHSDKEPKAELTLIIVKQKEKDKIVPAMRVLAPLGVFLPTGIALEIDGAAVGRVPYARCTRRVCYAMATASGDMLDKMRKGTNANFIIYQGPGLGVPMKISLNGFSAAFSALQDP